MESKKNNNDKKHIQRAEDGDRKRKKGHYRSSKRTKPQYEKFNESEIIRMCAKHYKYMYYLLIL